MLPSHGANPHKLFQQLGIPQPEHMIDLSENVNVAGIPQSIRNSWTEYVQVIEKYPDPQGEPFLSAIANKHHISKECVLVGNGAAELFTFLAMFLAKQRVILVHPTFSEYEATLSVHEAQLIHVEVEDVCTWSLPMEQIQQEMKQAKAIYLCTPNNPTGVLPPQEQLQTIMEWGEQFNCYVILDEAFMDWLEPEPTMIPCSEQFLHTIIVRSMTKMYGLAGIRLGYLIAQPQLIQKLASYAAHWHVNGLAATIGTQCLQEEEYRKQTIDTTIEQRENWRQYLRNQGCVVANSQTNYLCFQLPNPQHTKQFYRHFLEKGIVFRHTENYRVLQGEWLRMGLKTAEEMKIVEQEMTQWFQQTAIL